MASNLMTMISEKTKRHTPDELKVKKVSSHWKLLKTFINKDTGDPKKLDMKLPKAIGHGMHHVRDITSEYSLTYLSFNNFRHFYTGIDSAGKLRLLDSSDHQEVMMETNQFNNLTGIMYVSNSRQYIAWGEEDNRLKVLGDNFKVLSISPAVSTTHCAVYNKVTNEVITGGVGNVTIWSFRYGQKFLLQRKVLTEGIPNFSPVVAVCLEDTSSRNQRCFIAYDNSIMMFTLLTGVILAHFRDIHPRQITSILFFNPLKYLVTAAKDGSIKVWDDNCNIQIVFIGHLNSVTSVAVYPFGSYIMSCSLDCTIRIWSLDTCDEVERILTKHPVRGIFTTIGKDELFSYTSNAIQVWKIEHIHNAFTTVGSQVKSIKTTTHPKMPPRMVCICSDATVRLISPVSGVCITTLLVPRMVTVRDVVYAAAESLLFTLLIDGKILKSSTETNPCEIEQEWEKADIKVPAPCTCLCLYEYVVEDKMAGDSWTDLLVTLKAKKAAEAFMGESKTPKKEKQNSYDRTILLGGCMDGTIVVFDWQNEQKPGSVSFQIEGHRGEIVAMVANPAVDQVASAGLDKTIKIWRLFPFTQEALAPLLSLQSQETPRYLSMAHHRLSVAFHEPASVSYNVIVFKTTQKEQFEHSHEDDHADDITGLTACPKMRLFASCSIDGTIRIWDQSNILIRIIRLNASPTSLAFSSQKGDLLVGIGKNLHKIEYWKYMPQSYIYRMVALEFRHPLNEGPIPVSQEVKNRLSSAQLQRLTQAKSAIGKFTQFADSLTKEELDERLAEEKKRKEAYEKLRNREDDLQKLRDGVFEHTRKRPEIDIEEVRADGFSRYLQLFYQKPDVCFPDEIEWDSSEGSECFEEDPFVPERQPTGFFSISRESAASQMKKSPPKQIEKELTSLSMSEFERVVSAQDHEEKEILEKKKDMGSGPQSNSDTTPVRPSFSKENFSKSVKSAPIHGRDFKKMTVEPPVTTNRYSVDVPKSDFYPSPSHSRIYVARKVTRNACRRNEEPETFTIAPDGFIPNSVVVAMFKSATEEPEEEPPKKEWQPPKLTPQQIAELQNQRKKSPEKKIPKKLEKTKSKFASQIALSLKESQALVPTEELLRTPTPTPPQSPDITPDVTSPAPKKELQPLRPIEKLVTRPKTPRKIATPEKEPSPPPPPPTPLPEFVTQFEGTWWFRKFFPEGQNKDFPKPWSLSSFIVLLVKFLKLTPEYELKIHVTAAIMLLSRQHTFEQESCDYVTRAMVAELNVPDAPTAHRDSNAKQFIRAAVQLIEAMKVRNVSVVSELMAQFINGDEEIRKFIQEIFMLLGVQDPAGYFIKEMESFETSENKGPKGKTHLREVCMSWLEKWLEQFKSHIKSLASKIGRAESGQVVKGTKSPQTPSPIKGILKADGKKSKEIKAKPSSIAFEMDALAKGAVDKATPVEAINYFCDIQLKEHLEQMKMKQAKKKTPPPPTDNARNAVLVLPSIHSSKRNLARLGETHCSSCHPERETSLSLSLHLPVYHWRKTVVFNNVALHLNTVTLSPFPGSEDTDVYEPTKQHPLLTLRTSQKYFIPSQSYVQPDAMVGLRNLYL